jgi:uncharacterized protein YcnI
MAAAATSVGLLLVATGTASAHVSVSASDSAAGAYSILTFSVPHGCEGSPTTKVSIQIPEEVNAVTPTRTANWQVDKTIEALDEPITDSHGNQITERVGEVVYTADTPLPDGYRDAFELSLQLPDAAGETLVFPVVQTCEKGETAWTQVPEDGQSEDDLEAPAPSIEVTDPAEGSGGHGGSASETTERSETSDTSADAADDSGGNDVLTWVALGAGVVGAVAGLIALARTRRSTNAG